MYVCGQKDDRKYYPLYVVASTGYAGCREFWKYRRPTWATRDLDTWWWATHSRLHPIRECAWMVRRHQNDLMNDVRLAIHNCIIEGPNNTAKVISHQANGFCTGKNDIRNRSHCIADLTFAHTRACMCVTNPERKGIVWKSSQSHRS